MIREALDFLRGQFVSAAAPGKIDIPNERKAYYAFPDGSVREFDVPPGRRRHQAATLEDFADTVNSLGTGTSRIWMSVDGAFAYFDDDDRRDTVTLTHGNSSWFQAVSRMGMGDRKLSQIDLIRLLRNDLRSAVGSSQLLADVRRLKWRTSAEGNSIVTHGNESLGKTVEASVSGGGDIPDILVAAGHLFTNAGDAGEVVEVSLLIEVLPDEQKFSLTPVADELSAAIRKTLAAMQGWLRTACRCPVHLGTPEPTQRKA